MLNRLVSETCGACTGADRERRSLPVAGEMQEAIVGKSVLGILDNESEAREVVVELTVAGFRETDIEVVHGSYSVNPETNAAPFTTTVYERPKNTNVAKTITTFFHSLLGDTYHNEPTTSSIQRYADDQSYYAEALERGRIVLIIRTHDQESADYVCKVLNRHGGDNISADTQTDEVRGVTTIPVSAPESRVSTSSSGDIAATKSHLTPSERTDGRIRDRGVRVYDYAHAAEAPGDLADPQPDSTTGSLNRTAKP
jgi:hypothetical protein